jgi:hypothetical protein
MLMKESLSGNCQTSLMVTVAEAAEMQAETISSLRFGLSCGKISKAGVQRQVVQDVGQHIERMKA